MAKYVYSGVFVPFTTARAGDVAAEFQAVQSVSATEEKRVDDAIKFPASESTDIRIVETPAQRALKVMAFDALGALAVKSVGDAGVIVTAGDLPIVDVGGHYAATDVEAALAEVLAGAQTFTGPKTFTENILLEKASPQLFLKCADEATENTNLLFYDELGVIRALIYRPAGTDKLRLDARDSAGVVQAALELTESGDVIVTGGTFKATGAELTSPVINTRLGTNGDVGLYDIANTRWVWFYDQSENTLESSADFIGGLKKEVVATTSGTSIDITPPSWAERISIGVDGVSTAATNQMILQLGDAGGIETTGYFTSIAKIGATNTLSNSTNFSGFYLTDSSIAADLNFGDLVLRRINGNTWQMSGGLAGANGNVHFDFLGKKTLSAALTTIRLTTFLGTDAFDAGQLGIHYE